MLSNIAANDQIDGSAGAQITSSFVTAQANVQNYSKILGIALGDVAQIVLLVRLLKDMQELMITQGPSM